MTPYALVRMTTKANSIGDWTQVEVAVSASWWQALKRAVFPRFLLRVFPERVHIAVVRCFGDDAYRPDDPTNQRVHRLVIPNQSSKTAWWTVG